MRSYLTRYVRRAWVGFLAPSYDIAARRMVEVKCLWVAKIGSGLTNAPRLIVKASSGAQEESTGGGQLRSGSRV
jgi:hypothetical protein